MNDMTIHGGNADTTTMTSREIAELTGKEHKNILADIRNMLEKLEKRLADFSADLPDAYGRMQPGFKLDRELTLTLVSGYDIPLRHRVVTRLAELENAPKAINPANLSRLQLIEMAMQAEQERLQLEHKVGELEPKADALDRIATANGSFCIRDAAKTLQVQEKWLRPFMREHEWIYQRPMGHGWLAYADKLKQGLMEHKTTTGEKSDGSEWVDTQARITAKGLAKLSALIQEHGQPRLAA